MKKNIVLLVTSMFILFGFYNSALAQSYVNNSSSDNYLDATLEQRAYLMAIGLKAKGYTIVDSDITSLKEGQKYNGTRTCYLGNEYIVVAVTESGVKDLDLYIYDSTGRLVTKNLETNDIGITGTSFIVNYDDDIRIMAKNYKSQSSYKSYQTAVIVAYKPRFKF